MIIELTHENFDEEVLNSEIPVIVDFYAEWCGPCADLEPTLESLSEELAGKVKFCKVNSEADRELRIRYRIAILPWIIIFNAGKKMVLADSLVSKGQLEERIPKALELIAKSETDPDELTKKLVSNA